MDLSSLLEEIKWLETILPSPQNYDGLELPSGTHGGVQSSAVLAVAFRSVCCHMDLLSGNVLYVPSESRVRFVDFEFACVTFACFDVANYFCECAGGFDGDAFKQFPTEEKQSRFWKAYLEACPEPIAGDHRVEDLMDGLLLWTKRFALASDLMWVAWAVIMASFVSFADASNASVSNPLAASLRSKAKAQKLDYLAYAKRRREAYFARKESLGF